MALRGQQDSSQGGLKRPGTITLCVSCPGSTGAELLISQFGNNLGKSLVPVDKKYSKQKKKSVYLFFFLELTKAQILYEYCGTENWKLIHSCRRQIYFQRLFHQLLFLSAKWIETCSKGNWVYDSETDIKAFISEGMGFKINLIMLIVTVSNRACSNSWLSAHFQPTQLQLYSKLFSSCGFLIRLPLWGKSEEQYYFVVTVSLKLVLQLSSTLASF